MKFEPAVYEHAARLIGKTPWDVSRSGELMVQAHTAAFETYHHTPVVAGIDIYNLEAEAYGGKIEKPAGDAIQALANHLCAAVADILNLPSYDPETSGRIKLIIDAAQRLKEKLPDAVIKIPVSGPFSLASNLTGLETLLCDSLTDPNVVSEALEKITGDQLNFCRAIAAAGVGITVFESAATPPLVPPRMFSELVLPALNRLITAAQTFLSAQEGQTGKSAPLRYNAAQTFLSAQKRQTGKSVPLRCNAAQTFLSAQPEWADRNVCPTIPCIIGGDTTPILEALLSTGTKYVICPGETDQAAFMEIMKKFPDVTVRINMKPAVFCSAETAPAFAEADRVMKLAAGRENVCLGSGVLPYEAVPETVLAVKKYIGEY
ncbi:MAG: uroporphyrinogen decarboxylase family protein [Kiritimatiellales bacterium]